MWCSARASLLCTVHNLHREQQQKGLRDIFVAGTKCCVRSTGALANRSKMTFFIDSYLLRSTSNAVKNELSRGFTSSTTVIEPQIRGVHEAVQAGTFLLEKYLVSMQKIAKRAGPVVGSLVVALCESIQGVPESCFGHSRLD